MKTIILKLCFYCLPFMWVADGISQSSRCKVTLVRLELDSLSSFANISADSALNIARITNSLILDNMDILSVRAKVDSGCCWYGGTIYSTKHLIAITEQAALRLHKMSIPLDSGIPVCLRIDGVEIYRGFLWNVFSSFGNRSITLIQTGNMLTVTNRLPAIGDHVASQLAVVSTKYEYLFKE